MGCFLALRGAVLEYQQRMAGESWQCHGERIYPAWLPTFQQSFWSRDHPTLKLDIFPQDLSHSMRRLDSVISERHARKSISWKRKKISHQEHSGDRPHRQMNESKERETKTAQRHEMNSKYLNWSIRSLGKRFCEKPLKPRTVFSIEVNDHLSGETRPRNGASWRGAVLCILEHASLSVHTSGWLLALCGNPDMLGSVVCTPGELTAWIPGPSSLDAELTSPPEDSKGDHYFKTLPA